MTVQPYDPAADGWHLDPTGAFLTMVGPIWRRVADGETCYGFVAETKHSNQRGIVHGGMIMTFADYGVGMAAATPGEAFPVTVQIDVQFVSAAEIGDFVVSRNQLIRKTSSLLFVRGELTVGPRVIASVTGIWKKVPPHRTQRTHPS